MLFKLSCFVALFGACTAGIIAAPGSIASRVVSRSSMIPSAARSARDQLH